MSFVGIISTKKEFDFIEKEIKRSGNKNITLLHINNKSIENIKNIKFDIIVLDRKITNIKNNELLNILKNLKYLVINSDISFDGLENIETKIINYGLNQKATVTASSISNDSIIISLQRNIECMNGKKYEINESKINIEKYKNKRIYNILLIYILKILLE